MHNMNDRDDMLTQIFAMQGALDQYIVEKHGLQGVSMEEWIQKETLAMMSELSEVIDEVNFKWWKAHKPVDSDALKDELVDVMHFFVSMCLKIGMSAEELYERYIAKNRENIARQDGKSTKIGY